MAVAVVGQILHRLLTKKVPAHQQQHCGAVDHETNRVHIVIGTTKPKRVLCDEKKKYSGVKNMTRPNPEMKQQRL
jgi:galactitol-specific phosphotransferase system IIB component